MSRTEELKAQIAQLNELMRDGVLTGDAAREARAKLEAELVEQVLSSGPARKATQGSAAPASGASAANVPTEATPMAAAPAVRRSLKLGIAAFVVVFSVAGYLWLGNRDALSIEPGSPAQPAAAGAAAGGNAHAMGVAQIEGMIAKLAERLKASPDDAEGWAMMGRSYAVLGRHKEALPAFKKVVELRPKEAMGYADLADALGSVNGRSLDGEPEKLIKQALTIDPKNPKALFLSGTIAFNRNDAATAAKQWEQALRNMDPASDMAQQMQGAINIILFLRPLKK